jgi:hypothetical protein
MYRFDFMNDAGRRRMPDFLSLKQARFQKLTLIGRAVGATTSAPPKRVELEINRNVARLCFKFLFCLTWR